MGKGVTVRDVLLAILIIAIVGAGVGAVLGFSQNRFGLSQPVRVAIIAAFSALAARFAQVFVGALARVPKSLLVLRALVVADWRPPGHHFSVNKSPQDDGNLSSRFE